MALKPEDVAKLYAIWQVDCLIELSRSISEDFVVRPRQYSDVDEKIAPILFDLWFRYDTDPSFPGTYKRATMMSSLFGRNSVHSTTAEKPNQSLEVSTFEHLTADLQNRAKLYAERVYDTGKDSLLNAFADSAISMKAYLSNLQMSASVAMASKSINSVYGVSSKIMLDRTVASVFGRPPAKKPWPMDFNVSDEADLENLFDRNGAQLVEEMSSQLSPAFGSIQHDHFIAMQRVSRFGFLVLSKILDTNLSTIEEEQANDLLRTTYRWGSAMEILGSKNATSSSLNKAHGKPAR